MRVAARIGRHASGRLGLALLTDGAWSGLADYGEIQIPMQLVTPLLPLRQAVAERFGGELGEAAIAQLMTTEIIAEQPPTSNPNVREIIPECRASLVVPSAVQSRASRTSAR